MNDMFVQFILDSATKFCTLASSLFNEHVYTPDLVPFWLTSEFNHSFIDSLCQHPNIIDT